MKVRNFPRKFSKLSFARRKIANSDVLYVTDDRGKEYDHDHGAVSRVRLNLDRCCYRRIRLDTAFHSNFTLVLSPPLMPSTG